MRCMLCHERGVFERTVFKGTAPTTVRLCEPCAMKIDVIGHLDKIHAAESHEAKTEAVGELLAAVGQ